MVAETPPATPERIRGLADVANNLAWSWHREARALFRSIDENLWHLYRHNPADLLRNIDPARLIALAADPLFLERYDAVMRWLAAETSFDETWFSRTHPDLRGKTIAYFCAEFGVHSSVPIYSGGLGVLAGDHCKEAADLGVPLIGVGFMYPQGYFHQHISAEGWQEESYERLNWEDAPIERALALHAPDLKVRGARARDAKMPR